MSHERHTSRLIHEVVLHFSSGRLLAGLVLSWGRINRVRRSHAKRRKPCRVELDCELNIAR